MDEAHGFRGDGGVVKRVMVVVCDVTEQRVYWSHMMVDPYDLHRAVPTHVHIYIYFHVMRIRL